MGNRLLAETICTSEEIEKLTAFQETFFYRLMVNCDDYGRMDARPKILKSRLYPIKDVRLEQIEDAIKALISAELVIHYEVDGKPFLQMTTWEKHQRIRQKRSKYPDPPQIAADCRRLPPESNPNTNTNPNPNTNPKKEEKQKEERAARFVPPTIEEVEAYCMKRGNGIDPGAFIDFYQSKNWMIGKDKMRDWQAAVRTWERRRKQDEKTNNIFAQIYEEEYGR